MNNSFTKDYIADLENSIGYQFNDIELAEEALSHPSLKQINNLSLNYERFELLGDSILGFLVTEMIFNKFTDCEEGILAKTKAHVVSRDIIVKVAQQIDLAKYIIMTTGEENSDGRSNPNNLENTLEALIAAIYLDSNIEQVRMVVNRLWDEHINKIDFSVADPKTYLQEWLQGRDNNMPTYEVTQQEGPAHAPIFTVQVSASEYSKTGVGKSIKEAEKNAARSLLVQLKLNQT